MRERGFLDEPFSKAEDLIKNHADKSLVIVKTEELVSHAIDRMKKYNISQIPVVDSDGFVGSVDESDVFRAFLDNKALANVPIKEVMGKPYPIVKASTPVEEVSKLFTKENEAVLVELENKKFHIITKHDVISAIR
jgi:cystathionine beta-synthase